MPKKGFKIKEFNIWSNPWWKFQVQQVQVSEFGQVEGSAYFKVRTLQQSERVGLPICKVCSKEGTPSAIKEHMETKHLEGTLSIKFGQDFEVEAQARFWNWSLVSILLLILGWGNEDYSWSRFWSYVWSKFWSLSWVEMLKFVWGFEVAAWSRFWRWNLIKICLRTCEMT